jgi:guanine deaminase
MTDAEKLRVAIEQAERGMAAGNDPYGAAIFDGDALIAAAHNRVATSGDPIAHAEIETIRAAHRAIHGDAAVLARCVLYTSCEPCPICFAAIRWVGISGVVYASLDLEYGAATSAAPGVPPVWGRHVAIAGADELQQLAKSLWRARAANRHKESWRTTT